MSAQFTLSALGGHMAPINEIGRNRKLLRTVYHNVVMHVSLHAK